MNRHDLAWLTPEGYRYALEHATCRHPAASKSLLEGLVRPGIPGIVTRQEQVEPGQVGLGFSSHLILDGSRLRAYTQAPACMVAETASPFEVLDRYSSRDTPLHGAIQLAREAAARHGTLLGIYGSAALQLATGCPYLHPSSDLDLFARKEKEGDLHAFYLACLDAQKESGVRMDIELDIGNGFAVKLAELFSGQKTVLAKGLASVEIFYISSLTL